MSNTSSEYAEKLENVFRAYEKTLDLDIALVVAHIAPEDYETVTSDKDLKARIDLCDANMRATLIEDTRYLSRQAKSEGVRLAAIKELGRTLYPKRFKDENAQQTVIVPTIAYEIIKRDDS